MSLIKVYGGRKALMHYIFDNGSKVSIVWGAGTYSDNYDAAWEQDTFESTTVEIMLLNGTPKPFVEWFTKKYGDNPAGRIPVADIITILKKADTYLKEQSNDK